MIIRSADVILVLENGRIVESGNHDTLYDDVGVYAQMCGQQFWLDDLAEWEVGRTRGSWIGYFVKEKSCSNASTTWKSSPRITSGRCFFIPACWNSR